MSIVTVHGPYTFGSQAIAQQGSVVGVVDPTNGLKWDFRLDRATTRPDQDFSWAFPTDGTPTPQVLADPAVVTYATGGSKTATLTVTNVSRTVSNKALTSNVATLTTTVAHGFKVGQSVVVSGVDATFNGTYTIASTPSGTTFTYAKTAADVTSAASGGTVTSDSTQYPTAGSYPITVTTVAGVAPKLAEQSTEPPPPLEEPTPEQPPETQPEPTPTPEPASTEYDPLYDPFYHSPEDVEAYVEANPDTLEDVITAERDGQNRLDLIARLEG